VLAKRDVTEKITILPPWPHEDHLDMIAHADNPFRAKHDLAGKFVIMYSGNHSIASPLTTILQAALILKDEPRLVFMFIGGGLGKKEVEEVIREHRSGNIVSLPYQPLSEIKYSLSAADVHLVSLGEELVGIIHPCKIYGAMAVGRPILLLGPAPSHASEIIEQDRLGWHVRHGDVNGMVAVIQRMLATPEIELKAMGARAQKAIETRLSKRTLCGAFCDVLERPQRRGQTTVPALQPAAQSPR
jgi:colanic acid biosynthesis glycosyl transferase WcaI